MRDWGKNFRMKSNFTNIFKIHGNFKHNLLELELHLNSLFEPVLRGRMRPDNVSFQKFSLTRVVDV